MSYFILWCVAKKVKNEQQNIYGIFFSSLFFLEFNKHIQANCAFVVLNRDIFTVKKTKIVYNY